MKNDDVKKPNFLNVFEPIFHTYLNFFSFLFALWYKKCFGFLWKNEIKAIHFQKYLIVFVFATNLLQIVISRPIFSSQLAAFFVFIAMKYFLQ